MKKFVTRVLFVVLMTTLVTACSENEVLNETDQFTPRPANAARLSEDEGQAMRKEFGLALAKALEESKELRALLRVKALEMIDEDYDVLFALIRDEVLVDKLTVRELVAKHLKNKGQLQKIENALPTLTIFVPKLPNDSFSAQTWDTEKVVPLVAIKSIKTDDILMVDAKGVEAVLPAKYAPGFPVVVVKNSLRIIDDSNAEFAKLKSTNRLASSNGKSYKFLDDSFDRKLNLKKKKGARVYFFNELEDKVKTAYSLFPTVDAGWQRDHIYYNLTNTNTRGNLSLQFKEAITLFRMSDSDPMGAYRLISDATDDPKLRPTESDDQSTFWTAASYTFKARVIYSKKGAGGSIGVGEEYPVLFGVAASDLWDVQYNTITLPGFWPWERRYVYIPVSVTPKTVDLRKPLFEWDINTYSTQIAVRFEEVDASGETSTTVTSNAKFAVNFGLDATIEKIGLKFGTSGENTFSTSVTTKTQFGSDDFGLSETINFRDAIILGNYNGIFYAVREYDGRFCTFSLRPIQVQP
jgi:hypothetical protein